MWLLWLIWVMSFSVFIEPQKSQKFDHAEVIYYFFKDKKRDTVLIFTLRRFKVPSAFVTFVVDLGFGFLSICWTTKVTKVRSRLSFLLFFKDKKRDTILIFNLRRFIVPSAFVTFVVDLGSWVLEFLLNHKSHKSSITFKLFTTF